MGRAFTPRIAALLVALIVLVSAGVLFVVGHTMNRSADGFFAAVKKGNIADARVFLSAALRTGTDEEWLRTMLTQTHILDTESTHWADHVSGHGYGQLTGSVKCRSGEEIPLTLLFIRERLDWKLYAVRRAFSGELPRLIAPLVPDRAEQVVLVKRAMQDFAVSAQSHNMTFFRNTLAPSRRDKYTIAQFDQSFGHFFNIDEDLTSLADVEPVVQSVTMEKDTGSVILQGVYPTLPKQVEFQQKFGYEQNDWRLLSFHIDMKEAKPAAEPGH
jgi:hypothetical protein